MGLVKSSFRALSTTFFYFFIWFNAVAPLRAETGYYERQQSAGIEAYIHGHLDEAEKLFLDALREGESKHSEIDIALSLIGLGDVYQTDGRFNEALTAYRKSLSLLRRLPNSDFVIAVLLRNFGDTLAALHQYREALIKLNEASYLAAKTQPASVELNALIANSIGVIYYYEGKTRKAATQFQTAIDICSAAGTGLASDAAQTMNNLALIYRDKHEFQKAEDLYKKSIALTEARLGPSHPDLVVTLDGLGSMYTDLKRYSEAESQYQRSLAILGETKSFTSRRLHTLQGLGRVYLQKGDTAQAEAVLARAAELIGPHPIWNSEIPDILEDYSKVLKRVGKVRQAEDLHGRAVRAFASMNLTVRVQDLN